MIKFKTTKKMAKRTTLRDSLDRMEQGQTITFPIEKMMSVRTIASQVGIILRRKYTTRTDNEARLIYVTRVV